MAVSLKNKFKIWIVDDDFLFRLLGKKLINTIHPDCDFREFEDGTFFVDAFKNSIEMDSLPNLILLDINMPNLNGWGVLEYLKEQSIEAVPNVYMVSSSVDPIDKQRALAYINVQRFLVKPLKPNDLI